MFPSLTLRPLKWCVPKRERGVKNKQQQLGPSSAPISVQAGEPEREAQGPLIREDLDWKRAGFLRGQRKIGRAPDKISPPLDASNGALKLRTISGGGEQSAGGIPLVLALVQLAHSCRRCRRASGGGGLILVLVVVVS